MRKPEITCPHCNERGVIPLPEKLFQAYEAVCVLGGASTPQILDYIKENYGDEIGLSAVCNRMTLLGHHQLVSFKQKGRNLVYYAKK